MSHRASYVPLARIPTFGCVLLLGAILQALTATAAAQAPETAARPDRGMRAGGSYAVSDIENISLTNGNVNLSIPLASLPPIAGGKLSLTLRANYNSKLWDVVREQRGRDSEPPVSDYVYDTPQLSERGGWSIGGSYQVIFRESREDYWWYDVTNINDPDYGRFLQHPNWYRAFVVSPDGSEHEIKPLGYSPYPGDRSFLWGHYSVTPWETGQPISYYTLDGTYLSVIVYPNNHASGLAWQISTNDGTTIRQNNGGIQQIVDTNGNEIRIWSDESATHYVDQQTGREIKVDGDSGITRVWYQTVTGVWMHVDVVWGTTSVQGQLYGTTIPSSQYSATCQRSVLLNWTTMDVIREIVLPVTEPGQPGQRFSFSYNSDSTVPVDLVWWASCEVYQSVTTASTGWGALKQMVMPSGAIVNYSFSLDTNHELIEANDISRESITTKTVAHDGAPDDVWSYSSGTHSVTNPDGSTIDEYSYSQDGAFPSSFGGFSGLNGLVYKTVQSNKVVTERKWIRKVFAGGSDTVPGQGKAVFNPVVAAEYTTLLDDSPSHNPVKMSARTFEYDYNGNVLQETDYDWFDPALVQRGGDGVPTGVPAGATVLRVTNNSYYNDSSSSSSSNVYAKRSTSTGLPLILSALQQTTTGPATAQLSYDGNSYGIAPTVGNLTSKSVWDDVDNKWITTSNTYGLYGNLATSTDARGKVTQFFYDDATHALPNRVVVDPQNGTGTQTITTAYDYYTGLATNVTDVNGNTSTIDYTNQLLGSADPFGRPGVASGPLVNVDGVNQRHRTRTLYADSARTVTIYADINAEGDGLLKSQVISDMLGRTIESRQYETASSFIAVRKTYDTQNRLSKTSNPFRAGEAIVWTTTTVDMLGRVISVVTPDNAAVTTSYDANQTTVTDQAGKQRKSVTNAAGQLTSIFEDPNGVNYQTLYDYDVLGNLQHVYQGTQTRTFTYDSLSRLRASLNPESGTVSYIYDDNGNLAQKTDARGVITNYVYDALNRVTSRSYQNDPSGTPAVAYSYDSTTILNGKGRLASVSSSISSYSYSGFDATGKALGASQTIGTQTYSMSYTFILAGQVKTMTYPSGHIVTNSYDNVGRLNSFTGNLGEGTQRNYASAIDYGSNGAWTREQFGTSTPLYNKRHYNNRQQLYDMRVSTVNDDGNWNRGAIVNYYSLANYGFGTTGTDTNGNLYVQQHWIPNDDAISSYSFMQQNYGYDSLNRLTSVVEYQNGQTQTGSQSFGYDRWGNRTISGAAGAGINNKQFAVDTNTNRLSVPSGQSGTMGYDLAGNLTNDTYSGAAVTRVYDGENRMTQETQANNYLAGAYNYDGDGRRVKRNVNGTETWQVCGLGGELVAEYAANAAPSSPQKEYGYRNGELLITATVTTGWGAPPVLEDNPLNPPNQPKTDVKAIHITQLRTAINALRSHYNLPNYTWQKPTASGGAINNTVLISWEPIDEMRTALDQALGAPSGGYSAGLAQGQPIKAIHIQELRDRVLAAWVSGGSTDVRWLVTDQLGTPRMIFDQSGSLANISRHDYLPFGEELFAGTGGRTTALGYTANDNVRQQFTRKERDNETGLDYFGARFYTSTQGRFTSPDPLMASAHVADPQTWNRYTYALNNPLKYVDPDGMKPVFKTFKELTEDEQRILNNSTMTFGKGRDAKTLSGEALYNHMKSNEQKQLAGFLNMTAGLASIKFSDGSRAIDYVKGVTGGNRERIYANVDGGLKTQMETISGKTHVAGKLFIGPGGQAVSHMSGGIDYDVTFREKLADGPMQLSFASKENFTRMDMDMDEHCQNCGDASAEAAHIADGIKHRFTGGTNPEYIHKVLTARKIYPSYDIQK